MTNTSVLSASEAVKFLEWLDPVGLHNLVAIDPVTKAVEASNWVLCEGNADLVAWINARNGRMNLYFSINEPSRTARLDTKLRRDEIGAIRAFHVDIDNLEGEPDWDMDCLPSAIIDSGGGRWGFWKLAEPYLLDESDSVAAIEAQNRALTSRFHGDGQAHNIDRIARLPGTLNIPNEAKRKKGRVETVSQILSLTGMTYKPAEVASWCPPLAVAISDSQSKADQAPLADLDAPASVARATRYLLLDAPEAVEGSGGDETTYRVAARLKDFGVSREVAFDLLLDSWNETKAVPPWPAAELRDKVRNAYNHGTAAPGRNAANLAETEFEAVPESAAAPAKRKMQFEPIAAVNRDFKAESRALIDGIFDRSTMIVTYGESNTGKTHVALDQAIHVAIGAKWAGRAVHQGLVIYVAAEGGIGIQDRIMAHRAKRPDVDWAKTPFAVIRYPIDLMRNAADTKALLAEVKAAEALYEFPCVMVIVDTLSRALAGGDENSSADMGAFVKRCDEIRFATGAALHVIHHAGKNTAKGARGHSLLRAAVDTEIEIENGAILNRKQRDMEQFADLRFAYQQVVIGEKLDGSAASSVVLDIWQQTEFDTGLTPQTQKILDAAEAVVTQKIQNVGAENALAETSFFSVKEVEVFVGSACSHASVDRAFADLTSLGIFAKCKRGQYKLNRNLKTS